MTQIFQEDLTEKDVNSIIEDLKNDIIPKHGPKSGRCNCEPINGLTSLKNEPNFEDIKKNLQESLCD